MWFRILDGWMDGVIFLGTAGQLFWELGAGGGRTGGVEVIV